MTQMSDIDQTPLYLAVSLFLALTAVFFAAVSEAHPGLFRIVFNAWLVAGISTACLGILGYFHALPGAEMFTRYDRAAGAFRDPNVFGPFLGLPGIYLLYRLLTGRPAAMPLHAAGLLIVAAGIFLSFSRGAWGLFAGASLLMVGVLFFNSRSGAFRLRIIVLGLLASLLLVATLSIALKFPAVGGLFAQRAHLAQDYDSARLGRFDRYGIGFALATERPLGIGALVFGKTYGEDTHDIWLKALMDYGWLGFAAYAVLIGWTIAQASGSRCATGPGSPISSASTPCFSAMSGSAPSSTPTIGDTSTCCSA